MVVQCPTCQSKFRIADEKVTDRGVRVRCTACKSVFQVRKPGAASTETAPGPGNTMEMSALDAAALARPAPRNAALGAARTGLAAPPRPPAAAPPLAASPRVATAPSAALPRAVAAPPPPRGTAPPLRPVARPPAAGRPGSGAAIADARRLDADDLFGMSELTGDRPLGELPRPPAGQPAPKPPQAAPRAVPGSTKAASKPMPNFDDIDIEVDDAPLPAASASSRPPPRAPAPAARPPPAPAKAPAASPVARAQGPLPRAPTTTVPPPPPDDALPLSAPVPPPAPLEDGLQLEEPTLPGPDGGEPASVKLGTFRTGLRDPFEGLNLGEPGETGALELSTSKKAAEAAPRVDEVVKPDLKLEEPPIPPGRELVSSALTGLVGAACAIAVVVLAALSDDASAGWLGLGTGGDIVATRVVSGLYDTASGKPVFYIRGRVENRSKKLHGPVRVVAELVSEGGAEAKAESIAGAEPTAEDVWSLRSAAEADKLNRTLEMSETERRLLPGASLPFFAVIADPPQDLQRHRLHVRVEPVDAWIPPSTKPAKGRQ